MKADAPTVYEICIKNVIVDGRTDRVITIGHPLSKQGQIRSLNMHINLKLNIQCKGLIQVKGYFQYKDNSSKIVGDIMRPL